MPKGRQLSSEEVQATIDLYEELQSCRAVAIRLGMTASAVSDRLKRAGYTTNPPGRWGKPVDVEELLSDYVGGLTTHETERKYGIHQGRLWQILKDAGIERRPKGVLIRRYTLNQSAFSSLNPDGSTAYWIGFLAADGNISGGSHRRVRLSLKGSDHLHVRNFATFVGSSQPVKLESRLTSTPRKDTPSVIREFATIEITCGKLCDDLARYGVVPNKGLGVTAPKELEDSPDYWRGLIDGDGSVLITTTKRGYKTPRPVLCGGRELVEQFRQYVLRNYHYKTPPEPYRSAVCPSLWYSAFTGITAWQLRHGLYRNASYFLHRKRKAAGLIASSFEVRGDRLYWKTGYQKTLL